MAIPISHLFTAESAERNIEALRFEFYSLESRYRDCLLKCDVSKDGNRVLTDECKNLLEALQKTKSLLSAIDSEMFKTARKGDKFPSGRPSGAEARKTAHIRELILKYPNKTAKELERLADANIMGPTVNSGTFANKVSIIKGQMKDS